MTGQQAAQFAFTAVLARVLLPRDFGLIAMIAVFTGFAGLFVDLGFVSAIVQRPEIEERHLSSAFWVNLGMGTVATLAALALAPGVAAFYDQPRLLALTLATAPTFLITSLAGVQIALLERELHFKKVAVIETSAFVAGNLLGLALALSGAGVWSFVGIAIATATIRTGILWGSRAWRPARRADRSSISELWKFSGRLTGFNAINYWSSNADNLLIGRFVGTTQLAFYSRAFNLMNTPVGLVSSITSRVMFPALSRIHNDLEQVKRIYLRSLGLIALISFPCVVGLFAVARPFILTVYGTKWSAVVPLLEILCVPSFLRCLFQTTGWIYTSQGRTDLLFRWSIIWSVSVIVAFLIGLPWGVRGIATAYACCNVIVSLPAFSVAGGLIGVSLADFARSLRGVACASLLMGAVIVLIEWRLLHRCDTPVQLVLGVFAGIASYLLAVHLISPKPYVDLRGLLTEYRRRKRPGPDPSD